MGPVRLAVSEGSSRDEMRGDGAPSRPVEVDDGTISEEDDVDSVVDRVSVPLPLRVVAVGTIVSAVVARVSYVVVCWQLAASLDRTRFVQTCVSGGGPGSKMGANPLLLTSLVSVASTT